MYYYYVNTNAQPNGDHEVHIQGCRWFPSQEHAKYLGQFPNCQGAVEVAKRLYSTANGCAHCSPSCNTDK